MDYYYWNNKVGIGTIFGISKESHLVKRFSQREKREATKKWKKGKKEEQEKKGWRREKLEVKGFAGLTQVRGVYRRLMGIMG